MGKVTLPQGFDPRMVKHWYLVANRAEALIYEGRLNGTFHFVKRLKNPKGKLTELELVSDRPGRKFSSSRSGVRHSIEPRSSYHEQVAIQFARKIGKALNQAALQNEFSDLVVVAEPRFLGLVNKEFSERVRSRISVEVPREWRQGSDRELAEYLRAKLA